MSHPLPSRGLIVREPFATRLATGTKRWELRSRSTAVRGPFAILQGGTCMAVGEATLSDVVGPLSQADIEAAVARGDISSEEQRFLQSSSYERVYAWVITKPSCFDTPIPYRHPQGAVTWVKLDQPRPSRRPKM